MTPMLALGGMVYIPFHPKEPKTCRTAVLSQASSPKILEKFTDKRSPGALTGYQPAYCYTADSKSRRL